MREKLKSIVLESPISWVRGVQASLKLSHETIHQMRRFRRNYAKRGSMRKAHLETQIIFFTHQIEKGLSHRDFRFGFGKGVLAQFAPLRNMRTMRSSSPRFARCTNIVRGMNAKAMILHTCVVSFRMTCGMR